MLKFRIILRVVFDIFKAVSEVFKDGRVNGPMDPWVYKGYYQGPLKVHPGFKIMFESQV